MPSTKNKPRGRTGNRGRPPGGPGSINANNETLALDAFLLEDKLRQRGCRLPPRNFIIAHIIAKSINRTIADGRPIMRKVRGRGEIGSDRTRKQIEITLPHGVRRLSARYLLEYGLPDGLPDDWFQSTYTAVEKILTGFGSRKAGQTTTSE